MSITNDQISESPLSSQRQTSRLSSSRSGERLSLLESVQQAGEDFEWYPTTPKMIDAVAKRILSAGSILDIGAGDGRVLVELGQRCKASELYGIEKSTVLIQAQPESITPVGTELFEQNLACLPVDYIFCNPPYSQFEMWSALVIESGHAQRAYLVIPRRWKDSARIADAIKSRGATVRVIHSDDFLNAERAARAVIDILEVSFPKDSDSYHGEVKDPFDIWFDQNVGTFDQEEATDDSEYQTAQKDLAKLRHLQSIREMVEAFNEEHARMEENYRAIFKLDYALLRELSVNKEAVREGIKKKMSGLKNKYWTLLFERLDTITNRLATVTKKRFLEKLTGRASIAFTSNNAYAVVLWAIKHANKYYDQQLIDLFRKLSTYEGVMNYKSNQKTWAADQWRYSSDREQHSHYALDYRVVLNHYSAIYPGSDTFGKYDYPGDLHKSCHELLDDVIAVLYNLGYAADVTVPSRVQYWRSGAAHEFYNAAGDTLFEVKAFKNGNLHFRFMPDAIKSLNVEAGRLLGWLRNRQDVVDEMGYTTAEADRFFNSNRLLTPSNVKLLPVLEGSAA